MGSVGCGCRIVLCNELFRVPHRALSTTDVNSAPANEYVATKVVFAILIRSEGGACAFMCMYARRQWHVDERSLDVGICTVCAVILWLWQMSLLLHF